jgi:type VI protein secretion system component Hcp
MAAGPSAIAAIYMKYGDIKGGVAEINHSDWIEIDSFTWGTGRDVRPGRAGNAPPRPGPGSIAISKQADISTAAFMEHCSRATRTSEVIIHISEPAAPDRFWEYHLRDVRIGLCQSAGPTESITLNYEAVAWRPVRVTRQPRILGPQSVPLPREPEPLSDTRLPRER